MAVNEVLNEVAESLRGRESRKVGVRKSGLHLLLAFILEPIVWYLQRWHVPRTVGSFLAVALLLGCVYGVCYFAYNSASAFLDDLPKYSYRLRETCLLYTSDAADE